MTTTQEILSLTALLRSGVDPFWVRLRELLSERGLALDKLMLASSFPDDTNLEFGIVVTNDRRVYQFAFDYLDKPVEQGKFTEWVDLTERHASSPYHEEVAAALDLLPEA